jgi:regulator of nonsense transcripts 3
MSAPKGATKASGVLPIPAAVLQKQAPPNNAPRGPSKKAAAPRLKLIVRRLAPGLTQAEFEAHLGEEWKVGAGKVDWLLYRPGKVSKEYVTLEFCDNSNPLLTTLSLAKPSRPSRAYLHLTDQSHLAPFNEKVRHTNFNDAKNTTRDFSLIGHPCLELAPFPRVPNGRRRTDARQGTIDQDPDFQEFLESLTNPITKPHVVDTEAAKQEEKITTTPLIEYLREKKAAKDKPAVKAASKHGRHESKETRAAEKKAAKRAKEAPLSPEKARRPTKADRAAKEAVKVLNREATGGATQKQNADGNANTTGTPSTQRKRERPPVSVTAKIQRDLGISPVTGGRRNTKPVDNTNQSPDATQIKDSPTSPATNVVPPTGPSTKPSLPNRGPRPGREHRSSKPSLVEKVNVESSPDTGSVPTGSTQPAVVKKPLMQQQPLKGATAGRQQPPQGPKAASTQTASESVTATSNTVPAAQAPPAPRQAFLKHANASQGITEPLLHEALSSFGTIEHLEIDKRKGFAYVDFEEPEGLKKAIAASPVKVGQGAVQVLERRDRPSNPTRPPMPPVAPIQHHGPPRGGFRGRGGPRGRGGGRGGHLAPAPKVDVAQPNAPTGGT